MKIAIVVHGRFHAFDLAHALINRGHDVTLFTNYPAWAVERFGVARKHVCSFWLHGVAARFAVRLSHINPSLYPEAFIHRAFGRWAAANLREQTWDVIHYWSGVGEELLREPAKPDTHRIMMRGSSHILMQSRLLEEEERRTGVPINRPSAWMIEREKNEYQLAEKIRVLSNFAYQSFVEAGVTEDKLCLLPLGAQNSEFRPTPEIVEQRCQRILSGEPIRLLYVGSLSFQKGMWDLAHITRHLDNRRFSFRFVGSTTPEIEPIIPELCRKATLVPRQPQNQLHIQYAQSDLFLFPTIHDGFAAVLSQAQASGLPILATTNCAGPDIITEGTTGWVLPIRNPEAFIERLYWCDTHRVELAEMVRHIYYEYQPRTWDDVAADFERLCNNNSATFGSTK
jgi:glycosyltransferase involved in cell wall biosynthesis